MPTDPDEIEHCLLALELAVSVLGANVVTTLAPWQIIPMDREGKQSNAHS